MVMAGGAAGTNNDGTAAIGDIMIPRPDTDALVLYCTQCDWEKEAPAASCANVCSKCQTHGLRFVRYTPGVEDEAARAVIAKYRDARWRPSLIGES